MLLSFPRAAEKAMTCPEIKKDINKNTDQKSKTQNCTNEFYFCELRIHKIGK